MDTEVKKVKEVKPKKAHKIADYFQRHYSSSLVKPTE